MNVLVLDAGSASLAFELVETDHDRIAADTNRRMAGGVIERIGGPTLLTMSAPASRRCGLRCPCAITARPSRPVPDFALDQSVGA